MTASSPVPSVSASEQQPTGLSESSCVCKPVCLLCNAGCGAAQCSSLCKHTCVCIYWYLPIVCVCAVSIVCVCVSIVCVSIVCVYYLCMCNHVRHSCLHLLVQASACPQDDHRHPVTHSAGVAASVHVLHLSQRCRHLSLVSF